jgi:hypothetical protein
LELRVSGPLLWPGGRRRLRRGAAGALAALAEHGADLDAGKVAPPAGRREILEIRELPDGLEVLLRGTRYRLIRLEAEREER